MNTCDLIFDKKYKWFACKFLIDGNETSVTVSDFEEKDIEAATILSNKILSWFTINRNKVMEFAATDDLLKLKNEVWLEEDEDEITKEEFINRIVLENISIYSDGNFDVWYGDGDIFWGHAVKVNISKDFQFVESDMM